MLVKGAVGYKDPLTCSPFMMHLSFLPDIVAHFVHLLGFFLKYELPRL